MNTFSSSTVSSRPPWSKTLPKKKPTGRKEEAVTLPVLARRPSGQVATTGTARNNSLHAFLASQLDESDRDSYSRSQLRAMASSKLNSNARIHSSAERLAPLDPASFEKTRTQQRRPLPGPLQATINEVLAVRNDDERDESRDDGTNEPETTIPKVKRASPCKTQIQSRRPEWNRYIRRIMMTKGIQGSTLARYRRLVGIVARKNLNQSFAGAAERVVRYRLEFRSAVAIQTMILRFLTRRRQAKQLQLHRAAVRIQQVWRKIVELEKQRKLAEVHRLAKIERLLRLGATRSIQRSYRKYRHTCYLRDEERRQQEQASMLQKARLKLLRRYQSWRESSKRGKVDKEFTNVGDVVSSNLKAGKEFSCSSEETDPCSVHEHIEVTTNCVSIVRECVEDHQDVLAKTELASAPIDAVLRKNDERLTGQEPDRLGDFLAIPQQDEAFENVAIAARIDESQTSNQDEVASQECFSPPQDAKQSTSEVVLASEAKTEPEDDNASDENSEDVDELEMPAALSYPRDLEQSPDPQVDVAAEETTEDLTELATIAATALARTAAAERIAHFLLPKFQARQAQKTHAVIKIQCLARVYLAKLCMVRVRLATLHSLRTQLLASWHSTSQIDMKENLSEPGVHDPALDHHDDEDELNLELQGYQPSLHGFSENYIHVLPTRNGQIPPGVPLLQSSAGAPLLSLWKWSWPGEQWISNNQ
ncbi:hypothetical protein JG688_00005558 [Phytophthora aleatoria]|uniref:Uncharacterized protein n=1 Tax=Phytophthora aleatoria TaxID=2496075 RepID=A0A8J5MGY5_9STRA|nr:hypothetical protein JG688_00005558 [Phytophthora aleatoria]